MADPCPLWCVLLKKFAMGKMSAVEVQEMAAAAVKSGANSAEMLELEALGSYGSKPGNCNRDMLRKCFRNLAGPVPWKVKCSMLLKEEGNPVAKKTDCFLLLPHQWILEMEEKDMLGAFTCKDGDLQAFWKSQKNNPQMSRQMWASLDFSNPSLLPIPYVLHGDAAPYTEMDSLQVVSLRLGAG